MRRELGPTGMIKSPHFIVKEGRKPGLVAHAYDSSTWQEEEKKPVGTL